jgi:hypothetical protein
MAKSLWGKGTITSAPTEAMLEVEKDQDQTAFREGLFVRALGRSGSSNPYAPGSRDGCLWAEGWRLIDMRRAYPARYVSSPLAAPIAETTPKAPTAPIQMRVNRKAASPPQSFLIYLAFAIAFGGFLLMMLGSIECLSR